jgi:histidinol phosphatase-like PHP family hydrolase
MICADLHMHSTYSLDGNNTIAEMCTHGQSIWA